MVKFKLSRVLNVPWLQLFCWLKTRVLSLEVLLSEELLVHRNSFSYGLFVLLAYRILSLSWETSSLSLKHFCSSLIIHTLQLMIPILFVREISCLGCDWSRPCEILQCLLLHSRLRGSNCSSQAFPSGESCLKSGHRHGRCSFRLF